MRQLSPRFLTAAVILVTPLFAEAAETPDAAQNTLETAASASEAPIELAPISVTAPRVANIAPAGTFAMPITALRFDPIVDVQARSLGEAQADVSIRGGTFESTGFSIGAAPVYAPQTGHYSAQLPVSPSLFGIPEIKTGAANAQTGWNATAGSVAYTWLPVINGGTLSAGFGDNHQFGADIHAGAVAKEKLFGRTLGFDLTAAYSTGDGAFGTEQRIQADGTPHPSTPAPFSDHAFQRYNLRLQLRDANSQTDLFAGYQTSDFTWPNLYAKAFPGPLWREEHEEISSQLFVFNHRQELRDGDWVQFGVNFDITGDHYTIPVLSTYHARHTTRTFAAAADGRQTLFTREQGNTALRYRAGVVSDNLHSNALTAGRYNSRTLVYAGLYADQSLILTKTQRLECTVGLTYDDCNREEGAVSPVAGIAWKQSDPDALLRRIGLDYSESTQLPTYMALNSAPGGLFGGNRDLGRARSRNFELGADLATAGWTFTPTVFYRQDDALVDWVFDYAHGDRRSARAVDINTWGVELSARRSWSRFDHTLGYTWLHKDDNYSSSVTGSFYAMNFAEHRFTAAAVVRLPYGFELRCDNEFRLQEENNLRNGTDTPFFTSLGIFWHVPQFEGLTFSAQVDNLWDVAYEEVPLVPGAPRTFSARVSYTW
jgi:hypothetical protein